MTELIDYARWVPQELQQISLAALFGLCIGIERAWRNKVASLRTFSMISAGACIFSMLSLLGADGSGAAHDATRIAAQVVAGIGFLGGGVIFKTADRIEGITTASMIWLAAAIGMCCGFNQPMLAAYGFLIWAVLNFFSKSIHRAIDEIQEKLNVSDRQG